MMHNISVSKKDSRYLVAKALPITQPTSRVSMCLSVFFHLIGGGTVVIYFQLGTTSSPTLSNGVCFWGVYQLTQWPLE